MSALLAFYVAFHSPLRDRIATLFHETSPDCYFACSPARSGKPVVDALAALFLICSAVLGGWVVAYYVDGKPYELPLVFGLGCLTCITVPAAFVGILGDATGEPLLQPPFGPMLVAIPALALAVVGRRSGWRPRIHLRPNWRPTGLVWLFIGVAIALLVASDATSLMHPPTGYDALAYHGPLAVYFWRDGMLSSFHNKGLGGWALANPGTAELWYGLLRLVGGERIADLGQLPFAFLGSAAVACFSRRLKLGVNAALLAACAFLLAPIVVVQSGMQLNDLAAGALLMCSMALAAAHPAEWTRKRLTLIGLSLGVATTTKLVLVPGAVGLGLFVVAAGLCYNRRALNEKRIVTGLALGALAFLIVVLPWWVRNAVLYGNPVYPQSLPLLGRGFVVGNFVQKDTRFVPSAKAWVLYPLLERHNEESGYGALFAVGALPGLVLAAVRRSWHLFLYLFVAIPMLVGWWVVTQHEPRFLLALFGIGFAFLPWSLIGAPRRWRGLAAALLAVAAVFSTLVTFDRALIPLALAPNERVSFYDRVWGIDPAVLTLPDQVGILDVEGYAPLSYASDYALLGSTLSRRMIPASPSTSTQSIVDMMRRYGVRYAYVPASPIYQRVVEATYSPTHFQLVHVSTATIAGQTGVRRYLYRLR